MLKSVIPAILCGKSHRRDPELKSKWGTICPPVEMLAPDGKKRKTQAADLEGIFRIIQSIPSKKAEPVIRMLKYDHFQKKNNTIIALLAIAALAACGEFLWLGGQKFVRRRATKEPLSSRTAAPI